jgi:hypothetical protein
MVLEGRWIIIGYFTTSWSMCQETVRFALLLERGNKTVCRGRRSRSGKKKKYLDYKLNSDEWQVLDLIKEVLAVCDFPLI